MVLLKFALSPEHCGRLYDALSCLAKFSDIVSLEARYGQLTLSALNSTQSTYALVSLSKDDFFWEYEFVPDDESTEPRFSCNLLIKALISVFKGRFSESKGNEAGIERCEASLQDSVDDTACRLVFRLLYKQGVTKTYKLTYESAELMQALFDRSRAINSWKIQSRALRDLAEYFGPKTEQLDICSAEGQVTFTSFTEKVSHGKEIFKQPLQTAVTIDIHDFEEFEADEQVHLGINVKDFKNIVLHADSLKSTVAAMYSQSRRPLQFSYTGEGLRCEFTLMTSDGFGGPSAQTATRPALREAIRPNAHSIGRAHTERTSDMAPTTRSTSNTTSRDRGRLGRRGEGQTTAVNSRDDTPGLFVSADDEDQEWDPHNPQNEDEDMLGWDVTGEDQTAVPPVFSDRNSFADRQMDMEPQTNPDGIAPTQRASQVHGIFD